MLIKRGLKEDFPPMRGKKKIGSDEHCVCVTVLDCPALVAFLEGMCSFTCSPTINQQNSF